MTFRAFTEYQSASPEFLILPIFAGLSIAVVATTYYKRVHGKIVRELLARGADSPETALTLRDMDLSLSKYRRALFARGSSLRKVISCVEMPREDLTRRVKDKRVAADLQHLYITPEDRERAERLYDPKGARWGLCILCVLLIAVLAFVCTYFAEELISGVRAFVSHYFG